MAQFHGRDGIVKIGANTVSETKGWSIDQTAATVQTNEPTQNAPSPALTFAAGETQWSGSLDCLHDDTDTNGQVSMTVGATIALELYPEGDTVGDYKLSGNAIITSVAYAVSSDAVNTATYAFQGTGALAIGTAA